MAKKEVVEDIDLSELGTDIPSPIDYFTENSEPPVVEEVTILGRPKLTFDSVPESCLRNERVLVKHIPKQTGLVDNPKHILYGGLAEGCTKSYCVPKLSSGSYKNPLTTEEKNYLEYALGLEPNALSIHKKVDNYWDNLGVACGKDPLPLNLADPNDYIKYKILLTNSEEVAASMEEYQQFPLPTIKFVISREEDDSKLARKGINATMTAYIEYGKIEDDSYKLRVILEQAEGKPLAQGTKLDFLQLRSSKLVLSDPKLFLQLALDKTLDAKVLIKKAVEAGVVSKRGDWYYTTKDNQPLCGANEDPTLHTASKYLSTPHNQGVYLSIEAQIKSRT